MREVTAGDFSGSGRLGRRGHFHVPRIFSSYVSRIVLKRNVLNKKGSNTSACNGATGIFWSQRISSFEPCLQSILSITIVSTFHGKDHVGYLMCLIAICFTQSVQSYVFNRICPIVCLIAIMHAIVVNSGVNNRLLRKGLSALSPISVLFCFAPPWIRHPPTIS